MKNLVFDTTIWVDLFRGLENPKSLLLRQLLENNDDVYICPPIFQEVIQGTKGEQQARNIANRLQVLNLLELNPYFAAKEAAFMYQTLRSKGITIRKPNDCLIAYYTIHFELTLVHNDSDFDLISSIFPLKSL